MSPRPLEPGSTIVRVACSNEQGYSGANTARKCYAHGSNTHGGMHGQPLATAYIRDREVNSNCSPDIEELVQGQRVQFDEQISKRSDGSSPCRETEDFRGHHRLKKTE